MSSAEQPAESVKTLLGLAQGNRLYAGLVMLLLGVASSLAPLIMFAQQPPTGAGWTLHMAGMALFAAAVPVLFRGSEEVESSEPLTLQVVVFGLIIVGLAVFMRFYRLEELPFGTWFDEADLSLRALRMLPEPAYRPVYLGGQNAGYYLLALVARSFELFGLTTLSVRLVMALFGVCSVIVAFFLGRETYGNRFGLLLAFFFAVARWPITFDRLGMPTSTGPFFVLLTLLFLFRGRRRRSTANFAWAGLALGLTLGFHTSLRLLPIVVLAFLALWAIGELRRHPGHRPWRISLGAQLTILALATLLAAGPFLQFAVREPDEFWRRTRQISIFNQRIEPNLARAIASNTVKNTLMFNYEGDHNGRHNLPGEPMLDPVTGALFVLGLVLAISRFRRPAEMIFLIVLIVGLAGAILTVDFEAPQAQRAVGAMAGVLFLAALAVEATWRTLDGSPSPFWARPLGMLLLLVGGAAIVYINTNTYFVRQANNRTVWHEHNAIETVTAYKMRELDAQGATMYLSMFMHGHPTITFLAPGVNSAVMAGPDVVPLREPGDRPVAVLVDRQEAWIAEAVDRFYPNAQLSVATDPQGEPAQYTVVVPPADIRQAQGLQAEYWPGADAEGEPEISRVEMTIDARWPSEAPLDQPFLAQWQGVLYAPEFGDYQLLLQSPGPATLWLDGQALIESSGGEQRLSRSLAKGNHTLRLQAEGGDGRLRLAWARPSGDQLETIPAWHLYHGHQVASQGLLGSFYEGGDFQSEPALQRIDPFIDAYFHLIPLERPYGVIWSGQIEIPEAGDYGFGVEVNGRAQLLVDDQLVVDAPGATGYQEGIIDLDAGRHDLRLQFLDDVGGSLLRLYWTPPGQARQIIPSDVLFPALTGR